MDLVSIVQALWRHKIATAAVILLTALGAIYVGVFKAPEYQASASVLFVNPPAAPTAAQIAKDPALGEINANNPYANFGDLSVVSDIVINLLTSDSGQRALLSQGVDPRYQVALSPAFGSPPIILITGVGTSSRAAIRSANLIATTAQNDLLQIQNSQNVSSYYLIRSEEFVTPLHAKLVLSTKLRDLIAVLAVGAILLCVVVSVADVLEKRRRAAADVLEEQRRAAADDAETTLSWRTKT
jgi:capsular polysaccharide biosynthesis protein